MKRNTTPKIYVLHENQEWVDPLFEHLEALGAPYENWFLNEGHLDLSELPPEGIFYNRLSASSHTRNHRYSIELAESVLGWLEMHHRRVINDRRALTLEVRKTDQLLALRRFGFDAPASIMANHPGGVRKAAEKLNQFPFIVKPNRGGKGLGVKRYNNLDQLQTDITNNTLPDTLDGVWIVQQYVKPADSRITRVELIGGKFYYAVSVDASGGFELCPADACNIGDAFCPATPSEGVEKEEKFRLLAPYNNPEINRYEEFFKAVGIEIGAMEYALGEDGKRYIYDINTNTNYNSGAEAVLDNQWQGMRRIAEFLNYELIANYYQNRIRVA
ncbi:MAG: RimK family alpha-L-glutamate ligase [Salibacteraceae bacterium]